MSIASKSSVVRVAGAASMRAGFRAFFGIVAWGASMGCSAGVDQAAGAGGDTRESVGAEQQPLTACAASLAGFCAAPQVTTVSGFAQGPSDSEWICYPTEWRTTPTDYKPFFFVEKFDGLWQGVGWGTMTCVPQCCFNSNGGAADRRMLSQVYAAGATCTGGLCASTTSMWQGDAMPFVSGLAHYAGPMTTDKGESIWSGKTEPTSLRALAVGNSTVEVDGYSFFVGRPGGSHNIKALPSIGLKGYSAANGEIVEMMPAALGVCAFTSVGAMDDTHRPRIYRFSGVWRLTSTTAQAAKARCYYFNQSQP